MCVCVLTYWIQTQKLAFFLSQICFFFSCSVISMGHISSFCFLILAFRGSQFCIFRAQEFTHEQKINWNSRPWLGWGDGGARHLGRDSLRKWRHRFPSSEAAWGALPWMRPANPARSPGDTFLARLILHGNWFRCSPVLLSLIFGKLPRAASSSVSAHTSAGMETAIAKFCWRSPLKLASPQIMTSSSSVIFNLIN